MVRQREIAEKTGFSLSVISRALSSSKSRSDNISEETRDIIRKVASQMGYKSNIHASCLRKGKDPVVGVFLPSWGGALVYELVKGISDAARNTGLPLSFYFDMSLDSYEKFLDLMKDQKSSGIISYMPRFNDQPDEKIMKKLYRYRDEGGSIVILNTYCYQQHGFPHVSIDEEEGGRIAARYLKKFNCPHYAVLHYSGLLYQARTNGFSTELPGGKVNIKSFNENDRACHMKFASEVFEDISSGSCSGIFAVNDMISRYLLSYAFSKKLLPGKDFHIVSYDKHLSNIEPYEPPRIIQPFYEVGFRGLTKLYNLITGMMEHGEIIPPVLDEGDEK